MTPTGKALWYVESHFAEAVGLDEAAACAGVSRFQLSRAFGEATGLSFARYLRGRRLSEAARSLAGGAPDILEVALSVGYGSHEAFTRAFRDWFGLTPEQLRAAARLDNLTLMEPIRMDELHLAKLAPPRFEKLGALLIAGYAERYNSASTAGIPSQWQRFLPHFGHLPGQVGRIGYGVCRDGDDDGNFEYVCGAQVSDFSDLPPEFTRVRLAPQRYAVFSHEGHVSGIKATMNAIWNGWLPHSGHQAADAPLFERYGEEFDGRSGLGGFEIWLPVKE